MKTVTARATAKLELHENIEIEVPENTTPEEIEKLLREEADFAFSQNVQLSNGLKLEIEVKPDDE